MDHLDLANAGSDFPALRQRLISALSFEPPADEPTTSTADNVDDTTIESIQAALTQWLADLKKPVSAPTYLVYPLNGPDIERYSHPIDTFDRLPRPERLQALALKDACTNIGCCVFLSSMDWDWHDGEISEDGWDDGCSQVSRTSSASKEYRLGRYWDSGGEEISEDGWDDGCSQVSRTSSASKEYRLGEIFDQEGRIVMDGNSLLDSRAILMCPRLDWEAYRHAVIIAPSLAGFVDDLGDDENPRTILHYLSRTCQQEPGRHDVRSRLDGIAQDIIESVSGGKLQLKEDVLWEEGRVWEFIDVRNTLVPVASAMFRVNNQYLLKTALECLNPATIDIFLELLCTTPEMPFQLVTDGLNIAVDSFDELGERASALGSAIQDLQLFSDGDTSYPPLGWALLPFSPRILLEQTLLLRTSAKERIPEILSWSIAKMDEKLSVNGILRGGTYEGLMLYVSTFQNDADEYLLHKLLPLLIKGAPQSGLVISFLNRLTETPKNISTKAVTRVFQDLIPRICDHFEPAKYSEDTLKRWRWMSHRSLVQYMCISLDLKYYDVTRGLFAKTVKAFDEALKGVSQAELGSEEFPKYLREFATLLVKHNLLSSLHVEYQRNFKYAFELYLDRVVQKEPQPPGCRRTAIVCVHQPSCTACSALNAFLAGSKMILTNYQIPIQEFTHMKEPLDHLRKNDDIEVRSEHGKDWSYISLKKTETKYNRQHSAWKARVRTALNEFERFGRKLMGDLLGEDVRAILSMKRVMAPKDSASISPQITRDQPKSTDASTREPTLPLPAQGSIQRKGIIFPGPAPQALKSDDSRMKQDRHAAELAEGAPRPESIDELNIITSTAAPKKEPKRSAKRKKEFEPSIKPKKELKRSTRRNQSIQGTLEQFGIRPCSR